MNNWSRQIPATHRLPVCGAATAQIALSLRNPSLSKGSQGTTRTQSHSTCTPYTDDYTECATLSHLGQVPTAQIALSLPSSGARGGSKHPKCCANPAFSGKAGAETPPPLIRRYSSGDPWGSCSSSIPNHGLQNVPEGQGTSSVMAGVCGRSCPCHVWSTPGVTAATTSTEAVATGPTDPSSTQSVVEVTPIKTTKHSQNMKGTNPSLMCVCGTKSLVPPSQPNPTQPPPPPQTELAASEPPLPPSSLQPRSPVLHPLQPSQAQSPAPHPLQPSQRQLPAPHRPQPTKRQLPARKITPTVQRHLPAPKQTPPPQRKLPLGQKSPLRQNQIPAQHSSPTPQHKLTVQHQSSPRQPQPAPQQEPEPQLPISAPQQPPQAHNQIPAQHQSSPPQPQLTASQQPPQPQPQVRAPQQQLQSQHQISAKDPPPQRELPAPQQLPLPQHLPPAQHPPSTPLQPQLPAPHQSQQLQYQLLAPQSSPQSQYEIFAPQQPPSPQPQLSAPELQPLPEPQLPAPQQQPQPQYQVAAPEQQTQPQYQISAPQQPPLPQPQLSAPQIPSLSQPQLPAPQQQPQPQYQVAAPVQQTQPQYQISAPEQPTQPQYPITAPQQPPSPQFQLPATQQRAQPQYQISTPQQQTTPQPQLPAPQQQTQPQYQISAPQQPPLHQPQLSAPQLPSLPEPQLPAPQQQPQPQYQITAPQQQPQPQFQLPATQQRAQPHYQISTPQQQTTPQPQLPAPQQQTQLQFKLPVPHPLQPPQRRIPPPNRPKPVKRHIPARIPPPRPKPQLDAPLPQPPLQYSPTETNTSMPDTTSDPALTPPSFIPTQPEPSLSPAPGAFSPFDSAPVAAAPAAPAVPVSTPATIPYFSQSPSAPCPFAPTPSPLVTQRSPICASPAHCASMPGSRLSTVASYPGTVSCPRTCTTGERAYKKIVHNAQPHVLRKTLHAPGLRISVTAKLGDKKIPTRGTPYTVKRRRKSNTIKRTCVSNSAMAASLDPRLTAQSSSLPHLSTTGPYPAIKQAPKMSKLSTLDPRIDPVAVIESEESFALASGKTLRRGISGSLLSIKSGIISHQDPGNEQNVNSLVDSYPLEFPPRTEYPPQYSYPPISATLQSSQDISQLGPYRCGSGVNEICPLCTTWTIPEVADEIDSDDREGSSKRSTTRQIPAASAYRAKSPADLARNISIRAYHPLMGERVTCGEEDQQAHVGGYIDSSQMHMQPPIPQSYEQSLGSSAFTDPTLSRLPQGVLSSPAVPSSGPCKMSCQPSECPLNERSAVYGRDLREGAAPVYGQAHGATFCAERNASYPTAATDNIELGKRMELGNLGYVGLPNITSQPSSDFMKCLDPKPVSYGHPPGSKYDPAASTSRGPGPGLQRGTTPPITPAPPPSLAYDPARQTDSKNKSIAPLRRLTWDSWLSDNPAVKSNESLFNDSPPHRSANSPDGSIDPVELFPSARRMSADRVSLAAEAGASLMGTDPQEQIMTALKKFDELSKPQDCSMAEECSYKVFCQAKKRVYGDCLGGSPETKRKKLSSAATPPQTPATIDNTHEIESARTPKTTPDAKIDPPNKSQLNKDPLDGKTKENIKNQPTSTRLKKDKIPTPSYNKQNPPSKLKSKAYKTTEPHPQEKHDVIQSREIRNNQSVEARDGNPTKNTEKTNDSKFLGHHTGGDSGSQNCIAAKESDMKTRKYDTFFVTTNSSYVRKCHVTSREKPSRNKDDHLEPNEDGCSSLQKKKPPQDRSHNEQTTPLEPSSTCQKSEIIPKQNTCRKCLGVPVHGSSKDRIALHTTQNMATYGKRGLSLPSRLSHQTSRCGASELEEIIPRDNRASDLRKVNSRNVGAGNKTERVLQAPSKRCVPSSSTQSSHSTQRQMTQPEGKKTSAVNISAARAQSSQTVFHSPDNLENNSFQNALPNIITCGAQRCPWVAIPLVCREMAEQLAMYSGFNKTIKPPTDCPPTLNAVVQEMAKCYGGDMGTGNGAIYSHQKIPKNVDPKLQNSASSTDQVNEGSPERGKNIEPNFQNISSVSITENGESSHTTEIKDSDSCYTVDSRRNIKWNQWNQNEISEKPVSAKHGSTNVWNLTIQSSNEQNKSQYTLHSEGRSSFEDIKNKTSMIDKTCVAEAANKIKVGKQDLNPSKDEATRKPNETGDAVRQNLPSCHSEGTQVSQDIFLKKSVLPCTKKLKDSLYRQPAKVIDSTCTQKPCSWYKLYENKRIKPSPASNETSCDGTSTTSPRMIPNASTVVTTDNKYTTIGSAAYLTSDLSSGQISSPDATPTFDRTAASIARVKNVSETTFLRTSKTRNVTSRVQGEKSVVVESADVTECYQFQNEDRTKRSSENASSSSKKIQHTCCETAGTINSSRRKQTRINERKADDNIIKNEKSRVDKYVSLPYGIKNSIVLNEEERRGSRTISGRGAQFKKSTSLVDCVRINPAIDERSGGLNVSNTMDDLKKSNRLSRCNDNNSNIERKDTYFRDKGSKNSSSRKSSDHSSLRRCSRSLLLCRPCKKYEQNSKMSQNSKQCNNNGGSFQTITKKCVNKTSLCRHSDERPTICYEESALKTKELTHEENITTNDSTAIDGNQTNRRTTKEKSNCNSTGNNDDNSVQRSIKYILPAAANEPKLQNLTQYPDKTQLIAFMRNANRDLSIQSESSQTLHPISNTEVNHKEYICKVSDRVLIPFQLPPAEEILQSEQLVVSQMLTDSTQTSEVFDGSEEKVKNENISKKLSDTNMISYQNATDPNMENVQVSTMLSNGTQTIKVIDSLEEQMKHECMCDIICGKKIEQPNANAFTNTAIDTTNALVSHKVPLLAKRTTIALQTGSSIIVKLDDSFWRSPAVSNEIENKKEIGTESPVNDYEYWSHGYSKSLGSEMKWCLPGAQCQPPGGWEPWIHPQTPKTPALSRIAERLKKSRSLQRHVDESQHRCVPQGSQTLKQNGRELPKNRVIIVRERQSQTSQRVSQSCWQPQLSQIASRSETNLEVKRHSGEHYDINTSENGNREWQKDKFFYREPNATQMQRPKDDNVKSRCLNYLCPSISNRSIQYNRESPPRRDAREPEMRQSDTRKLAVNCSSLKNRLNSNSSSINRSLSCLHSCKQQPGYEKYESSQTLPSQLLSETPESFLRDEEQWCCQKEPEIRSKHRSSRNKTTKSTTQCPMIASLLADNEKTYRGRLDCASYRETKKTDFLEAPEHENAQFYQQLPSDEPNPLKITPRDKIWPKSNRKALRWYKSLHNPHSRKSSRNIPQRCFKHLRSLHRSPVLARTPENVCHSNTTQSLNYQMSTPNARDDWIAPEEDVFQSNDYSVNAEYNDSTKMISASSLRNKKRTERHLENSRNCQNMPRHQSVASSQVNKNPNVSQRSRSTYHPPSRLKNSGTKRRNFSGTVSDYLREQRRITSSARSQTQISVCSQDYSDSLAQPRIPPSVPFNQTSAECPFNTFPSLSSHEGPRSRSLMYSEQHRTQLPYTPPSVTFDLSPQRPNELEKGYVADDSDNITPGEFALMMGNPSHGVGASHRQRTSSTPDVSQRRDTRDRGIESALWKGMGFVQQTEQVERRYFLERDETVRMQPLRAVRSSSSPRSRVAEPRVEKRLAPPPTFASDGIRNFKPQEIRRREKSPHANKLTRPYIAWTFFVHTIAPGPWISNYTQNSSNKATFNNGQSSRKYLSPDKSDALLLDNRRNKCNVMTRRKLIFEENASHWSEIAQYLRFFINHPMKMNSMECNYGKINTTYKYTHSTSFSKNIYNSQCCFDGNITLMASESHEWVTLLLLNTNMKPPTEHPGNEK